MVRQRRLTRLLNGFGALVLLSGLAAQVFLPGRAFASQITARSLTLSTATSPTDVNSDQINDGGSMPGGKANQTFQFTVPSATSVDTIQFQYCTTAASVTGGIQCNAPTGLDASGTGAGGVTLANDAGTGWAITNQTANSVTLSGTALSLQGAKTFELDNVVNPSTANTTFFVRITTYTGGVGGTAIDSGTVAASTANFIKLTGTMPESLVFCTGAHIDINASSVPDCTTATSGDISFNQLFSPSTTSWATSQMAAATNATSGYAITVLGPTMKSGGNSITAIGAAPDISRPGTLQFGMNLVDDFTPSGSLVTDPTIGNGSPDPITYYNGDSAGTGAAINPVSDGTNYNGIQAANYSGAGGAGGIPTYAFHADTTTAVAKSDYSAGGPTGSPVASNTQRYTSTYIVNVSGNLPAGSYSTTLTYICTPTF